MKPLVQVLFVVIAVGMLGRARVDSVRNETTRVSRIDDDKAAIMRMEHEWLDAIKGHNIDWFERKFASDCTEINSGNGQLKTKEEDIADFKTDKTIYDTLEFSHLKVRVEGNAAVGNGITHVIARDEQGQKFDVRLSFTDTFIKRDGRWQVWAAQHTRVRP